MWPLNAICCISMTRQLKVGCHMCNHDFQLPDCWKLHYHICHGCKAPLMSIVGFLTTCFKANYITVKSLLSHFFLVQKHPNFHQKRPKKSFFCCFFRRIFLVEAVQAAAAFHQGFEVAKRCLGEVTVDFSAMDPKIKGWQ